MDEHHLQVAKTARYFTLGTAGKHVEDVWFVCHGYGQLASYFLEHFDILQQRTRLIIAPEGLSRFYLSGVSGRVGASWMTWEDRLEDIKDYVLYLDQLYDTTVASLAGATFKLTLLGFSQGTATVARWFALSEFKCHQLVLWAGLLPPDLDIFRFKSRFADTNLLFVAGESDSSINPEALAQQERMLKKAGHAYETIRFVGGHELNKDVLQQLAES